MEKLLVYTNKAPEPIGPYSQAIRVGNTVYFSGQIPLDPQTNTIVTGDFESHVVQVFENLSRVAETAGGNLSQIVKLTIYLIDLTHFSVVNEVMARYFSKPYPARATVSVSALPKGASIEIEGVMVL